MPYNICPASSLGSQGSQDPWVSKCALKGPHKALKVSYKALKGPYRLFKGLTRMFKGR